MKRENNFFRIAKTRTPIGLMLSCHQCRLLLLIIIAVTLLFTSYLFVAYSNCNIVVASMMSSVLLTVFCFIYYCIAGAGESGKSTIVKQMK